MNAGFEMKDYEDILSTKEIMNAKGIFERGDMEGDELENANFKKAMSQVTAIMLHGSILWMLTSRGSNSIMRSYMHLLSFRGKQCPLLSEP